MQKVAENGYARRVSLVESVFLATPPESPMCIQLFVEGDGAIDPTALAAAVAAAAVSCPGSCLTRRGKRWVHSGVAPQVRVLDGDRLDRENFTGLHELHRPLVGERDAPTCEVVLLTGARPTVVFRAHHGVMDGQGALIWARETFRALRGEPAVPATGRETEVDLIRRFRAGPAEAPIRPTTTPPLRIAAPLPERHPFMLRRTVPGVHSGVVAKMAVALTELCSLEDPVFTVPVDLRRHDPAVRSTANLTTAINMRVPSGATWQQVYGQLLRALTDKHDVNGMAGPVAMAVFRVVPIWLIRRVMTAVDARVARNGTPQQVFSLTHLGRHDTKDFSTSEFTASTVYSLPTYGLAVIPTITIYEVDDHTEIVISGDDAPGLVEQGRFLLSGMAKALCAEQAADRPSPAAVDPADDVEGAIARIWAGTLGVPTGDLNGDSDFHHLGGTSISLLTMMASVSRELVGADRERTFMAGLERVAGAPTLTTVAELVRAVRAN